MFNSKGEVIDVLDVSQFIGGHSAFECIAYSCSLLKYAGKPGSGPTGSILAASNLAQFWYGHLTGSTSASNHLGMSLTQEHEMLNGLGLAYHDSSLKLEAIKAWLALGYPLILCGAETGMHDMDLGDRVPYGWELSGNHAIVASGVASDGNLLIHDCASIAPTGVRPGPRRYDAGKLALVTATVVQMPWLPAIVANFDPLEANMIDIHSPNVATFFSESDPHHWQCTNGHFIQFAILDYYKSNNGLLALGLPITNEVPLDAHGNVRQFFERGCLVYDPGKLYDNPPGSGSVYAAHVYDVDGTTQALGADPYIGKLLSLIQQLQAQPAANQDAVNKLAQIKAILV